LAGLAVNLDGTLLRRIGPAHLIEYTGIAAMLIAAGLALANAGTLRSFWSARPSGS
jgi:hypothetical protein